MSRPPTLTGALALSILALAATSGPADAGVPDRIESYAREALEWRLALHRDPQVLRSFPAYDPLDDERWSSGFALPQFDGRVAALVEFRGELIAAGVFMQAAGVPAARVARWNGQSWAPLGDGLLRIEPLAAAVFEDRLYVGGFDADGTPAISLVFCWDGTRWENVSSNLIEGVIRCFAVHEGALVAGGQLVWMQGEPQTGVVRLQSNGYWAPVGTMPGSLVTALAADGPALYAGGYFDFTFPQTAPAILFFSGGAWDTLARARGASGPPAIGALVMDQGDLVVGGNFLEIEGVTAGGVARWHAGQWTGLGAFADFVSVIRPTTQGLLVGGYFWSIGGIPTYSVGRWNGSGWEAFGEGLYYGTDAMVEFGGRIVAGGTFTQSGDFGENILSVASWDGVRWTPLRGASPRGAGLIGYPGNPGTARALEVLDGSLYLGGGFMLENDAPFWPVRGVARWNGSGWDAVGPREFNGSVYALAWYDGQLIAAGGFGLPYQSTGISNIARWTGQEWEPLGAGTDRPVYALAVHDGDLFAAGSFQLAGGLLCSGVARWDGATWWPVGSPTTPAGAPIVFALEVHEGELYAGGDFSAIGTTALNNVAKWDGAAWQPVGAGIDGRVMTLEVHEDVLWAGGDVTTSTDRLGVFSRWDGMNWNPLPVEADATVERLLSADGDLFAVGRFREIDDFYYSGIARWDGLEWNPVGRGLGGAYPPLPYALASYDGGLWVAGTFTLAGGKSAFHVARWDGLTPVPRESAVLQPARPNPFDRTTAVRFAVPPGGTGSVAVLDLNGRVLRTLREGPFGAGPLDVTWDGRTDDGRLVRPGIYFIQLRSSSGDRTARVAFVP